MKAIIKAICGDISNENGDIVTDRGVGIFAEYHGEYFSEYIDNYYGSVHDAVSGGDMKFSYEKGELYVTTTYTLLRDITKEEQKQLVEYTQGQWSDGIGEGFEQQPSIFEEEDLYVSPWWYGQKATCTIVE